MGLLSKIMKPIVRGRAPIARRNMGGLEPRVPMPPKRKGGLAGLIRRAKDKRLQRPISIGGVGGGRERPINIGRPVAPPGGIRPLPITPPSIGRPIPPISIGGIGGGRPMPINIPGGGGIDYGGGEGPPLLPLQPPAIKEPRPIELPEQRPTARPILRRDDIVPIKPLQLPPKRDPIMSIGGPGGGITDDRAISPLERPNFIGGSNEQIDEMIERGAGALPQPGLELPPLLDLPIKPPMDIGRDPLRYDSIGMPLVDPNRPIGDDSRRRPQPGEPGATPIVDEVEAIFGPPSVPQPAPQLSDQAIQQMFDKGNNPPPTPVVSLAQPAPVTDPVTPTVDPVTTAPTPSATTEQGTDPIQSMPAPVGALDPVLLGQTAQENLNDPLVRALYFGTQDQPGFYQQLQQAGANLIGQDVPLQQTAGLTPLELLARQQAVAGLGGFEPFFQQNKDLIDQAIGQSRRAEALRDPYFNRAERQMQIGLGDELRGIREARGITTGATDRFGRSLGRLGRQQIGATGAFGRRMGDIEAGAEEAADIFGRDLDATQAGLTGQVDEFGNRLTDVEGLQRGATDIFGQGVEASQRGFETGVGQFGDRLTDVEGIQAGATDQFGRRLSDVEARGEGAAGRFGQSLGGIEAGAIGSTDIFGSRLGESEDLIRGTLGGYDQGMTQQFYNPFEDAVVQQTIDDVLEAGEKQDIASRAREISAGAFGGSRARLGAMERQEALGEGLAKALGRIRQQGFSEAQRTGLGEFARQREAERAASRGLSGLASTRLGAESSLFDRLTSGAQQRLAAEQGVVDLLGRTGQQQLGAQQQLANLLQSTAGERLGATRGLEEFRRSGAGQQLAAQQALSDSLSNMAGQRLGAGQSLAEFQRGTAGQQLASQQALQNLLQSSAGQQLGAQQQLGSTLRGLTGDQFGAQQQLAANLMGYGAAGAGARQNLASGLLGIGQQRGAGAAALGQQLAGFGQQIGGIGSSLDALRRGQRGELAGYGATGRGIAETGLSRIYQQQIGQQQRPLNVLGQIGSMLPGYQQTSTQIGSQYGLPTDPSAAGLGAAFSAYGALAPRQGQS